MRVAMCPGGSGGGLPFLTRIDQFSRGNRNALSDDSGADYLPLLPDPLRWRHASMWESCSSRRFRGG